MLVHSLSQVSPQYFCLVGLTIRRYPFILLGGERHCESKVPCPRTFYSHRAYKWVLANCQGNLTKCWGVYLRWTTIVVKTVETLYQISNNLSTTAYLFNPSPPFKCCRVVKTMLNRSRMNWQSHETTLSRGRGG